MLRFPARILFLPEECKYDIESIQLTIEWEPGIKRPGLETENQQRFSSKNKDERGINPLIVHLQVLYRSVAHSHSSNKRMSDMVIH